MLQRIHQLFQHGFSPVFSGTPRCKYFICMYYLTSCLSEDCSISIESRHKIDSIDANNTDDTLFRTNTRINRFVFQVFSSEINTFRKTVALLTFVSLLIWLRTSSRITRRLPERSSLQDAICEPGHSFSPSPYFMKMHIFHFCHCGRVEDAICRRTTLSQSLKLSAQKLKFYSRKFKSLL